MRPSARLGLRGVALVALCLAAPSVSGSAAGLWRVVSVTPSNSLIVANPQGERSQVVLAYLSIPSGRQPYADRAAAVLRAQLVGRDVNLRPVGRQGDAYTSALLYVNGNNFNEDFLRRGHAWVNHLQNPPAQWRRIERAAQATGAGLWATERPVHPIDWDIAKNSADRLVRGLDQVAADKHAHARMYKTFVANRSTKLYYPFGCPRWMQIPDRDIVIFTSAPGALSEGYRPGACK
jgi:endonuclease YncB( thermonuclease family)